jgi:hypothetical protein
MGVRVSPRERYAARVAAPFAARQSQTVSESATGPATWENRNFARVEGLWYMRHADALARWPILDEPWARRIEAKRLGVDHPDRGDIAYLHGVGR